MARRPVVGAAAAALLAALVSGCRPPERPRPAAAPSVSAAVDVGAVVRRVRRSFRPAGAGLAAEGGGWRARLESGVLSVGPARGGEALALGPALVERGGEAAAAGEPRRERDGGIAIARGGAIERLATADAGVEQSFAFPSRPAGTGDLRVRLRAAGLEYVGATSGGLHFADRRTGRGVRYGQATFVDAAGSATKVEARWRGGEIVLAVPAAVLDRAAYPAALDSQISAEAGIDVPLQAGAPEAQRAPAVASDGVRFLVAWEDRRDDGAGEIWAARVAADGIVLDPVGIPVATGVGERPAVGVAAGGGVFAVVWQELPARWSPTPFRALRLAGDGSALDTAPVDLGTGGDQPGNVAATFDGSEFRVAFANCDTFDDCALSVARLPLAGLPPAPPVSLETSPNPIYELPPPPRTAIACAGDTCLATWAPGGRLGFGLAKRTAAAGAGWLAPAGADAPAVAFDGTAYLLVWQSDPHASGRPDLVAARLGANGARLDAGGLTIATGGAHFAPAIAFDGAHHLVAWEERTAEGRDVLGARVNPDGTLADAIFLPIAVGPGTRAAPAVAIGPGGALVAFEDRAGDSAGDVAAVRVGAQGQILDPSPILVSRSANRQLRPAAAVDGASWLVVWEDTRGSGTNEGGIYGARVAVDGTVLDPAGLTLSDGAALEDHPAVAGCGGGWRIAWVDHRRGAPDVYAARVDQAGAVLDPGGIAVASGGRPKGPPAIACAGEQALVAWSELGDGRGFAQPRVAAARLAPDGTVAEPDGAALSALTSGEPPAVAAAPGGFAVVWSNLSLTGDGQLFTAFVPAGLGAPGAATLLCAGPSLRGSPAVAYDGRGFQLAFEDGRADPGQLRTARLSAAGAPLDGCGIALPALAGGRAPALAFEGTRHALVFSDGASGELRGAAIAPGGALLESFSVAAAPEGQRNPAVACDRAGRCLVASDGADAGAGVSRVRIRTATFAAPAPACAGPADCDTGFCVDGVCCDSACGGGDPSDCLACSVAAGAPADGSCAPALAGTLCGPSTDQCQAAARCGGTATACPAVIELPEGARCDDLDPCTRTDACVAGACVGGDPVTCADPGVCATSRCDPATGQCVYAVAPASAACDDGNACTLGDACGSDYRGWGCHGAAKACPADACHSATCDPGTGACGQVVSPDGSGCNDDSHCTIGDTCRGGACVGTPVQCPAPDACHQAGLCNRMTGACSYANQPDGTGCDDGDACTRSSSCRAGACVGSGLVACPTPDACHVGVCDPATGSCSTAPAQDGTPCDDGDACTEHDSCRSGACSGNQITCPAPDQCHEVATCGPASHACLFEPRPDGTSCDDGDTCTAGDACRGGTCQGEAVACLAPDACHAAACDPVNGGCAVSTVADGSPCPGGACKAGSCVLGDHPVTGGGGGCSSTGSVDPSLAALALAALSRRRRRR